MKLTQNKKEDIIAWFIVIVIIGLIMSGVIITVSFLMNQVKNLKNGINEQSNPSLDYDRQIQSDYKSGKITCDYIKKLMIEKETYQGMHPLSYSDTKNMMRTYWNANNCGFEWNWWD